MSHGSIQRRPGFLLALGLCAIGGAVTLLGHLMVGPLAQPVRVPLANVAGTEACPSFSPDGRHLAYSGRGGPNDSFHVWVRSLPGGAPQALTSGPASDVCPVWSPDGASLALLRLLGDAAQYVVIPAVAPSPEAARKVAETNLPEEEAPERAAPSWMSGGNSLAVVKVEGSRPPAIFAVSLVTGAARRITDPPSGGDFSPSISPDGRTLAFVRGGAEEASDIWLCDADGGGLRRLTFDSRPIRGLAWSPDSRDLVYAAAKVQGRWQLWRIPAFGGSPREVPLGAKQANDPAIALSGRRLAYTETPSASAIWLAVLHAGENPRTRPVLRSAGSEAFPSWSPDGRQIAWVSNQSGSDEIWISDAAGGNRVQVTDMKAMALDRPRWSPDGRRLLFATRGMPRSVYTVPAAARMAQPKPQPLEYGAEVSDLSWSHDGKSVYAESNGFIFKIVHGTGERQLTRRFGARQPEESPDGKYVYYRLRRSIWRIPAEGGAEEEVVTPEQFISAFQPAVEGVYYMGWEGPRGSSIWFYDFEKKKGFEVLAFSNGQISRDAAFDVSPDGKCLLYPKIDRTQTDLVLVENFR